ncbi:MAG: DoxX family protein [Armatimonadetes bacterium]|nr:DoxX family protein [Armatimonadota bacterium]MCK6633069.1 DoxX family protein [Fimbriimonadaceae bacterium]NOG39484.1 DoxX family protein [Armatimonadota bacterium]NUM39683.1 DoxX family protein [Armatimonadota bacterium]RIJ98607.1 MAG: DoxX family protein [Armatimonadota bacterium]
MSLKQIVFGSSCEASKASSAASLVLRLGFGLAMAFAHGMGKLPPPDGFVEGVRGMGFPLPEFFAWLVAVLETGGGILVAVGLFARPLAFFLFIHMSIAFFLAHSGQAFAQRELAFLFGAAMLAIAWMGTGKYGLDAFFAKKD